MRHSPPPAVILAGGHGSRIRHVVPDLPKPLIPVAGRPFLEWVVRHLHKQGVGQVVLSAGYLGEKVEQFARALAIDGLALTCVREPSALGTAGGFVHALEHSSFTDTEVLVCNGDSLALADLAPLFQALRDPTIDAALLAVQVSDAARFGTLEVDHEDLLLAFREKRAGPALVNAGVYLLRRERLQAPAPRPLSFEYELFPALLARGSRIRVVSCDAPFIDIGTEASLRDAEGFIQKHAGRLL